MRNDYFVSKKQGKHLLNNYSTLHFLFGSAGFMDWGEAVIGIILTSSLPPPNIPHALQKGDPPTPDFFARTPPHTFLFLTTAKLCILISFLVLADV